MNLQQFKQEFRIASDWKYDPWGSIMEVFFQVAFHALERGLNIPSEWGFNPGMDSVDEDSYWFSMLSECSDSDLLHIGQFCNKYNDLLHLTGKSY